MSDDVNKEIEGDQQTEDHPDQPDDSEGQPFNEEEYEREQAALRELENKHIEQTNKGWHRNRTPRDWESYRKRYEEKQAKKEHNESLKPQFDVIEQGVKNKRWDDPQPASKLDVYRKKGITSPLESREILRAKRRARVRELVHKGKTITDIAKEVGAERETIYGDITVIGIMEKSWVKKPGFLFGKLSAGYSFKINSLKKELAQSMDARDVVSIIEAMEKVDRGWIKFLFQSGTIEQQLGKVEVEHVMKQAREEIQIFQEVVMVAFKENPELWAKVKPQLETRMAALKAKRIEQKDIIEEDSKQVNEYTTADEEEDGLMLG